MSESLAVICNVLNSLPHSVIVCNREGKVLDANQAAKLVHEVSEIEDLQGCFNREEVTRALNGEYCSYEYAKTGSSGKKIWLKVQCNPVYTDASEPIGVSIFEKDITAQKEMIEELLNLKIKGVRNG
ncbi:MAG TPA: PAS domain-containing protein [Methanosarcina sp.]|nr:PAS domain-containing protein [Methanosarcina sp.]